MYFYHLYVGSVTFHKKCLYLLEHVQKVWRTFFIGLGSQLKMHLVSDSNFKIALFNASVQL